MKGFKYDVTLSHNNNKDVSDQYKDSSKKNLKIIQNVTNYLLFSLFIASKHFFVKRNHVIPDISKNEFRDKTLIGQLKGTR